MPPQALAPSRRVPSASYIGRNRRLRSAARRSRRPSSLSILPAADRRLPSAVSSAEDEGLRETCFRRLLVLLVHILGGLGQSDDHRVDIHAPVRRDLVLGDEIARPRFHRAERAALDAGYLD